MRQFVLLSALMLAACAADVPDERHLSAEDVQPPPETRFMDTIELTIELPTGAYALDRYTRTYMFGERKVLAIYTTHGQPGRVWVSRPADFPVVFDGGCSVVNVAWDLETRSFLRVTCNGEA